MKPDKSRIKKTEQGEKKVKSRFIASALACVVSAFVLMQAVQAADTSKPTAQPKKKAVNKKATGGSTKFIPGSQETTRERSARLTRECKGAVNAGACEGYTR